VVARTDSADIVGVACGISDDGLLGLDVDGVTQWLLTGDVSVRAA